MSNYQPYGHGHTADYYNQPPNAPPPPQHVSNGQPMAGSGEKQDFQQTFRIERPKYNDIWAGVLLIAVFAGFVAVSGISIHGYATTRGFNGDGLSDGANDFGLTTATIILFAIVLLVSAVLSVLYIWLARLFTKQFIWITGILNIVLGFATAFYMLSRRYWSGGIVFLLFAIFTIICFVSWIRRIPFSVVMLQTSIDVARGYGHVFLVSFLGGVVMTVLAAWYQVTLVAVYIKYEPSANNPACRSGTGGGSCSNAKVIGLLVFITFAAYWISEWVKNTIHTTIAGVYGSWYFAVHNFPANATRGAFKRAMTYSFGSISLGSLVVALINLLRQILSIARSTEGSQGDMVGFVLFCVLQCFVSLVQWIVEFVNRYAFAHIALYGKAYFAAAKDTWRMIKDRGMTALVNECLVGPVFSLGATFIGFAAALVAYGVLLATDPPYNRDGAYTPVVVAFSFLIGLQICNVVTTPLASGIETIFVAAAWDPQVLMRDHPDLYARMVAEYPQVQVAIHA